MPILGAHMSICGGFFKAVERAKEAGCDCVQIFTSAPQRWPVTIPPESVQSDGSLTKSNNQWRAKEITDAETGQFQATLAELNIVAPLSHSSYLINLAAPDAALRQKSIDAFIVELQRAEQLGISYVVLHPGSYTTTSEEAGLEAIIDSLNEVHQKTAGIQSMCLLENTAGQGSNLGWQFEQLATLIIGVDEPQRLGVCFDTCHALASGYPLGSQDEYNQMMATLDKHVGLDSVKAIHLNDSKRELGSRVDRHEHIGQGELGLEPFRWLLNDDRFQQTPMYLETPKGDNDDGEDWDVVNLRTLRALAG